MTFLYFLSALFWQVQIITSQQILWIHSNYFQTDFFNKVFTLPSHCITWHSLVPFTCNRPGSDSHSKKNPPTSQTSHYPIYPSSSDNLSHFTAIKCVLFVFSIRMLTFFPVRGVNVEWSPSQTDDLMLLAPAVALDLSLNDKKKSIRCCIRSFFRPYRRSVRLNEWPRSGCCLVTCFFCCFFY